jgi:hypothetical protein
LTADKDEISAGKAIPHIVAPRVSVVIPTRNEAGNVQELFRALTGTLNGVDHEVIVVDDSTDTATRPLLAQIGATASHWRVLERAGAEQTGLATAVTTGIAMARGDAICVMDGDLQHPPDVVPRLLQSVEEGVDLAIASRYTAGGKSEGFASGYRQLLSHGSRLAAYAVFPEARRTSDPLTGFFCVRRAAIAGLEFRPVGFKILLEILVLCPRLRVVDVPFVFGDRWEGESKASARQGVLYLRHIASLFLHVPDSSRRSSSSWSPSSASRCTRCCSRYSPARGYTCSRFGRLPPSGAHCSMPCYSESSLSAIARRARSCIAHLDPAAAWRAWPCTPCFWSLPLATRD